MYTAASLWLICLLFPSLNFWNINIHFLVITFGVVVCLFISTFPYLRIYRIVRHYQLQIHAQQQAVESSNAEHNLNMMRSKKSAMNTFIYYICMILCYSPTFINLPIYVISQSYSITVMALTSIVVFLNSSINPCLYCWRLRELRLAVLKLLRKLPCKQTDVN